MPSSKYFDSEDNYKAVLLHELAHSTMHETRLNRNVDLKCKLSYAKEELVAELSSAMLSAHFGIQTEIQNHAIVNTRKIQLSLLYLFSFLKYESI